MIPGLKPTYDVRAKVRVGIKKQTSSGKEIPASVDYFVCDDPEFVELYGGKPQSLRVRLPFADAADCFGSGMEWWRGKQLTCYSKGELMPHNGLTREMVIGAFRVQSEVGPERVIGDTMGRDRVPIACRFRDCPQFKTKDCKPMGRLQFFLDGGRMDAVLQFDTHSWNTIEGLEASLLNLGDLRGRVFDLSVAFRQRGRDRFPVVSIAEVKMEVNTQEDVGKADQLLKLAAALDSGDEGVVRSELAGTLELTNPGWRQNEPLLVKLREVGVVKAAEGLIAKHAA